MKIVLLGPPGAGKGTQAASLSASYGIPAISTGHIIRQAIEEGTAVGQAAKTLIERGELLPDETVIAMVRERLSQDDTKAGYILDGFPRTVEQAEEMERLGIGVDVVINIQVADETLVERLSGRRGCHRCGATYHIQYNPPKHEGICDVCGEALSRRQDDEPETIRQRLAVYHKQTEPLVVFYERQGKLRTVQGQEDVAHTTALVQRAVGGE